MRVTTIDGLDCTGDGGLLGIAVSPHLDEDGLSYAYVTTEQDDRIIRIATGDQPTPILTAGRGTAVEDQRFRLSQIVGEQ